MTGAQATTPPRRMTIEEYLEFEKHSENKHDYVNGFVIDVRAVARTAENHAAIQVNWLVALSTRLKEKTCRAHGSDLKVRSKRKVEPQSLGVEVPLREIYTGVTFSPEALTEAGL